MSQNSRLSDVLHVLLHMAHVSGPVTSEVLAKAMNTHPVVLRRIMAGLRDHGYVHSEKGHGGGWTLARDLSEITLRDIYLALGSPAVFTLGNRSDAPDCLIEKAVNSHLDKALDEARQVLISRFGDVTLAMLNTDVQRGKKRSKAIDLENSHAS